MLTAPINPRLSERLKMSADHLGSLRRLLDLAASLEAPTATALEAPPSESLPEVQPLLSDQIRRPVDLIWMVGVADAFLSGVVGGTKVGDSILAWRGPESLPSDELGPVLESCPKDWYGMVGPEQLLLTVAPCWIIRSILSCGCGVWIALVYVIFS